MKKTIIVNIPTEKDAKRRIYVGQDQSVQAAQIETYFPVISNLINTIEKDDSIKIVLIVDERYKDNCERCIVALKAEIEKLLGNHYIEYVIVFVNTISDQKAHEHLIEKIIKEIDDNSELIADITYAPADLIMVLKSVLDFGKKFLGCKVSHIFYGMFETEYENSVEKGILCELSFMYAMDSLIGTMACNDPKKARQLLPIMLGDYDEAIHVDEVEVAENKKEYCY